MKHPASHAPGFDRHHHPSELGLDRYLYGEADASQREAVDRHLAGCATCAAIVARMRAVDAALPVPLPPSRPPRVPRVAARARQGVIVGGLVLALAASLALVVGPHATSQPRSPEDGVRARGGGLELKVHVHDGTSSREIASGGRVRPGDRLRFEVLLPRDGFLIVLGVDDAGEVYAGWPQVLDASATRVTRGAGRLTLPSAIELDASPGDEHLFALLCDSPRTLAELRPALLARLAGATSGAAPATPSGAVAGCELAQVDLRKAR